MKAWTWMKMASAMVSVWLALSHVAVADAVGTSWRRVDSGAGEEVASISWNGPLMVGVGSGGLVCTSTDGKSWTNRFQGVSADLRGVVWNGTHYVAVGSSGAMLRSANGLDWQRVEMPGYDFRGITWTGSQFVALSDFYYISTSADGVTWTQPSQVTMNPGYGIEYFDGAFYVRNQFGLARSTDLTTWTQVNALSNNQLPRAIRKCNDRLISVGPGNAIYSSLDGITWTVATKTGSSFPPSGDLTDVEWNGTEYVATGAFNVVWRSVNGQAWTQENAVGSGLRYVRWLGGEFVAGDFRSVQTSGNGRGWKGRGDRIIGNATVWAGDKHVTVGNYGYLATSGDFATWDTRDTDLYSNLGTVVWTGSCALAGGADGVVLRSTDGETWARVAQGTFTGTVRVVWTGTQVYAFSGSGTHVSTDGITWTALTTGVAGSLDQVKWLRGMFVNVTFQGLIHTSPDGVTWTPRASGTTSSLYAVGASADEFLAGGVNGVLLASPDGVTWTRRDFPAVAVSSLEHRFGRWFLSTGSGIWESADGVSWEKVAGVKGTSILVSSVKLVWGGGKLVCVGLEAWTSNGVTWEQLPLPTAAPDFSAVAKGPGGYVAVGSGGAIWQSSDGYAWQRVESPTAISLTAITSKPALWVVAGAGGTIVTSPDGVTWTLRTSGTSNNLSDVAWNGLRFAAVGASGTILSSEDGVTWSPRTSGTAAAIGNVVAMGTGFRALAPGGRYLESTDGLEWTLVTQQSYSDVGWNGSYYVALSSGTGGAYANVSSADGLTWTRHPMGTTTFFTGICWTGSLWVACGQNGAILTSPDGVTWTPRTSGVTTWLQAAHWNGTLAVIVGHGSTVLYSPDGVTWSKGTGPLGTAREFEDVAWSDGRYVAAGKNGASATSTDGMAWQNISGSPGSALTVEKLGARFVQAGTSFYSTTGTAAWAYAGTPNNFASIHDMDSSASLTFAATTDGVHQVQPSTAANQWKTSRVYACPWLDNIVANGNEFVAAGNYGTIVLSRNGNTWQTVQGGRENTFAATAWNGTRMVGVGSSQLQVSEDGVTWGSPVSPLSTASLSYTLADVVWTGSRFLAMGGTGSSTNLIEAGPDGANWTRVGNATVNPKDISGIAGDDELLVAVGGAGKIVVSDGLGDAAGDYQAWIASEGADSGSAAPLQDANGDGITNLMAYVFGIPAVSAATPEERGALPMVSMDGEDGAVLTFDLLESYRPGTTYFVEVSQDLKSGSWQTLQQYSAGWASGAGKATVNESPLPGGGVRITVSNFPGMAASGFFRLRAALP